ncbi:hypothetical protein KAU86_04100 [bacterium]|nr:hypothetical protein [bacterium]MCK4437108.1 hypothetical protein [bacterium]
MREDGVTLVEVLVVSVIIIIVLIAATTLYLASETVWHESTVQGRLQQNASIVMQKMIKGVEKGVYGIRDSKTINYYPPAENYGVEFTGIDIPTNINRRFYRSGSGSGSEIKYWDGSAESTLAEDISNLTFTKHGSERLTIDFTMSRTVGNKDVNITLKTDVTIRN